MKPFTQIRDVDKLILADLDTKSLLTVCKLENKYVQSICTDDVFEKRILKEFSRLGSLKPIDLSWKQYYFYLIYWTSKLQEEFDFHSNDLRDDPRVYYEIISLPFDRPESYYGETAGTIEHALSLYNDIMREAAQYGFMDLVEFAINRGADDFQAGLDMAVFGGNLEAVHYFEKMGANNYQEALDYATDSKLFRGPNQTHRTISSDDMIKYIKSKNVLPK